MNKATLLKGFAHGGRFYNKGDVYEGTDAELQTLARQGYVDQKDLKPPVEPQPVDTGTGKGTDVTAGSSGDAGVSHLHAERQAKQAEYGSGTTKRK